MQKKEKSLIYYAVVVNITHLILCLTLYLFRLIDFTGSRWGQLVFMIIELLIWFICSIMFGLGTKTTKMGTGFKFSIITLLPIILITGAGAILGYLTDPASASWPGYFFVGAAINFWHKPALLLTVLLQNSAYLIYAINLALILAVSLIGVSYSITVNKLQIRKIKRRSKKQETRKTAEKTKKTKEKPTEEPEQQTTEEDVSSQYQPDDETVQETIEMLEEIEKEEDEEEKKNNE